MSCSNVQEQIPGMVRHEITGQERIVLINHIQTCAACRDEYLTYLKIFYTLDKETVLRKTKLSRRQVESIERNFLSTVATRLDKGENIPLRGIKGTGLGLAIAKEYTANHNGTLELLTTEENKGAHFRMTLPQRGN